MRALIAAWIVTLATLAAVVTWLQLSYEPPPPPAPVAAPQTETEAEIPADEDAGPVESADIALDDEARPEEDLLAMEEAEAPSPEELPDLEMETASAEDFAGPGNALDTVSPDEDQSDAPLVEESLYGPLPLTVGGRQPWRVYAQSREDTTGPRVALIVTGLGLNARFTERAIEELPPAVSLAFSPYGTELEERSALARAHGHETLVMVPMEPLNYPDNDPGPHSLLTSQSGDDNVDRLHYVLSRFQNYVGLINDMGSKFTASPTALRPIMADLQKRGLLFVDARASADSVVVETARAFGVPWAENTLYIDNEISATEIDRALYRLEALALKQGLVIGVGHPYPVTIERIQFWLPRLQAKGIALVPVSAAAFKNTVPSK